MQEITWAIITICCLILLRHLVNIKNHISRIYDSTMQKTVLCAAFLSIWAGVNFLRCFSPLQPKIGIMTDLMLYIISAVAFLAGLFFSLVAILEMIPVLRQWMGKEKDIHNLAGKIAEIPLDISSDQFICKVSRMMADILMPVRIQITSFNGNDNPVEYETTTIQYIHKIEEKYYPNKITPGNLSCDVDQCSCRNHKNLMLDFSGGGYSYRINFHLKWVSRYRLNQSRYETIQSVVDARLRTVGRLEATRAALDISASQNRLFETAGQVDDITAYLKKIYPIISETVACDYISIAVLDSSVQNMYRYTYTDVGGRLMERGICYPLKNTIALKAAREKSLLIANTLESDYYRDDYHLYKSGFSSRLVYPLINSRGYIRGILTLASVKPRVFNDVEPEHLHFINEPLCRLIEYNRVKNLMGDLKKQIGASFNLTFGLEQQGVPEDFYNQSARLLSETLPASMCRIWGYNQGRNCLEPLGQHSLHTESPDGEGVTDNVGLELLSCHKNAIEMGKAIIVNQANPDIYMDACEIRAMGLKGVKSAILAPMKLENRIMGIISIGEVRNWERRSLGPQELLYSQIISTITALAYDISKKNENLRKYARRVKEFDSLSQIYSTFSELPARLSSPVSSILGAAQLIRKKVPFEAGELSRYNDIILKGANTIVNELNKYDDIRNNLKEY